MACNEIISKLASNISIRSIGNNDQCKIVGKYYLKKAYITIITNSGFNSRCS